MPSEQSFADRIGKFVLMKEACESMSPAFEPAAADIAIPALVSFITTLHTCCTNVTSAATDLKNLTGPRAASIKVITERVTRALSRVKSNRAWASQLPAVKTAADKARGVKPPKSAVTPSPAAPKAPAQKARGHGGSGYRDVEGYLRDFIAAVAQCQGYDTGAPVEISLLTLRSLHDALKTANIAVPEKAIMLQEAQADRLKVFVSKKPLPDGSASLHDRWGRIKNAVEAQYGRTSAEFARVWRIKY